MLGDGTRRSANRRRSGRPGAGGFTLLELLVVLAIILILIGLLFTGVAWARFQARCVLCASNLRQWGIACLAYAGDHNGFFPRFDNVGGQSGCTWDIGASFFSKDLTGTNTLLASYGIRLRSMYFCPFDTSPEAQNQALGQWGVSDWGSFSYICWLYRTTL